MCFPSPFESIRDIGTALSRSRSRDCRSLRAPRSPDSATDRGTSATDKATMKLEKKILKAKMRFEKKEAKELKKVEKRREKERKKEEAASKKNQPPITECDCTEPLVSDRQSCSESVANGAGDEEDDGHARWGCTRHGCAGLPESLDGM